MSTTLKIRNIRARPVMVPFRRAPVAATGAMPDATLILIDVETEEGITGRSYLFAFGPWTMKPIVGCIEGLLVLVKGDALTPFELDAKLRKRLTLTGATGLVGLALAGIDMAFWDALAQSKEMPLVSLLGGQVKPIRAYNSTGLWIQEVTKLADEAEKLVSEGNFSAIKLRLGRDDFSQDLAAVRSVMKRVGDRITVMCDFNQKLTVNEGILRGRALDDEGLYWIEEPIRWDDFEGAARIAAEVQTPIQAGENLISTLDLSNGLALGAFDYVMPDVQRIGGVTGWMRAAALTHAAGMEMSSHLFPEYSSHLLAVTPTCHWLEYVDWATPIVEQPYAVKDGYVQIPDRPGAGITWNEEAVARYLVR